MNTQGYQIICEILTLNEANLNPIIKGVSRFGQNISQKVRGQRKFLPKIQRHLGKFIAKNPKTAIGIAAGGLYTGGVGAGRLSK